MKKNLLVVMMTLLPSLCSWAQKEYNMVITLNNGTTVTLGHNDIKEITFNDGEIAISGNMVNTIDSLAGVTLMQEERIMKLQNVADETRYVVEMTRAELDAQVNEINAQIEKAKADIDYAKAEAEAKLVDVRAEVEEAYYRLMTFVDAQNALNQQQEDMNNQFMGLINYIFAMMQELHPELNNAPEVKKINSLRENPSTATIKEAIENLKSLAESMKKKEK